MTYLDTSVLLAELFAEDVRASDAVWSGPLVSSRLLEYEVWTRIHARGVASSHGDAARELLGRVAFLELAPLVLARVLDPFPAPVRTLDAIHLASLQYLREHGMNVPLATFDARLAHAARACGFEIAS